MMLQLRDMEIRAELPKMGRSMKVYKVKSASLEERKPAIEFFREAMDLGELVPVDVQDSLYLVSDRGEIQFYRPSGALWVRDAKASDEYTDEKREWNVVEAQDDEDPGNTTLALSGDEQERLAKETAGIFEKTGLLGKGAYFAGVELDQVAKHGKEGKTEERFAGEANVRFLYKLDGVSVDGGGAKSYAFFNPGKRGHKMTGIYHAWRDIQDARDIEMIGIEEALERTVAQDRELVLYHEKQHSIKLTRVDLVYFALPPFNYQEYVFPSLRVVGSVISEENKREGFEFARFYNAAPPRSYAKADLYADYLITSL